MSNIKNQTRVLYIRFPGIYDGGVQFHSEVVCNLLIKYATDDFLIFDLVDVLRAEHLLGFYQNDNVKNLCDRLLLNGFFKDIDIIVSDIGLLEHREFHFVQYLKSKLPHLISFITIHDPPKTVVNFLSLFEQFQSYWLVRGIRKVYNTLLGGRYENKFFSQGHNLLVLSNKGVGLLTIKLNKLSLSCTTCPKIHMFPPPLYYDMPSIFIPESKIIGDSIDVGYLGFISHAKGLDLLMHALGKLNDTHPFLMKRVKLRIAGDVILSSESAYKEKLLKLSFELKINQFVEFLGFIEDEKIHDFLKSLDLLILPYRDLGSGSASGPLIWAQTIGIPVMASESRNFAEIIKHNETGILFPYSESGNFLYEALLSYLSNEDLRKKLMDNAKVCMDFNSWEKTANRYFDLFKNSLS